MNYRRSRKKAALGRTDPWLLITTLVLAGIGIVMIYSASFVRAGAESGSNLFFLKRQILWVLLCTVVMLFLGRIQYRQLNSPLVAWGLFGFTLLLLIAAWVPPFGGTIAKTHRWLSVGSVLFQPAELAKLSTVVLLAYLAVAKQKTIGSLKDGVLPFLIGPLAFMVVINRQPDLGSCVVIGALLMVALFISGTRLVWLGGGVLAFLIAGAAAVIARPYRLERIMSYLNPWADEQNTGYQIIQSLIAFGSGGLFGLGLGEGRQKLFYLPAPHTDFILSTVGEELGLIGLWFVLALFAFLLYCAFRVALRAPDLFGLMLGFGLATLLALQILINGMVVMGLLPNKGLALPFLSYGGSSALLNFAVVGLLLSISRHTQPVPAKNNVRRSAMPLGEVAR